jgi:hypothetical protein
VFLGWGSSEGFDKVFEILLRVRRVGRAFDGAARFHVTGVHELGHFPEDFQAVIATLFELTEAAETEFVMRDVRRGFALLVVLRLRLVAGDDISPVGAWGKEFF